jgi:tetratricopeptide (TPR) repeat protein
VPYNLWCKKYLYGYAWGKWEWFLKRLEKKTEAFMNFGFALLAILFCFKGDMDSDLFWHMATGRWIIDNWQFPTEDTFSFVYAGAKWVNITWIFQITSYLCMQWFDYAGVLLLCALLYMSSTIFTWFSLRSITQQAPSFFVWLLFCVLFLWLERRWVPRPEAYTHFFLALEILILLRFCLHPEKYRSLWFLPLIIALWTNSHGMFILGLILFGFVFMRFPRKTIAPFAASVLATLLNPYGWEGATYPFYLRNVSADPVYRLIQEGMSFLDPGVSLEWYTLWGVWILLLMFSLRTGYRMLGWVYFLWVGFAIYFSTTMVRNLSPSVLMTAPFILAGVESLFSRLKPFKKALPCVILTTFLLCVLVVSGKIEGLRDHFTFGWKISENETLVESGDFFEKNTNKENIFSSPEFSNYMMWRQPGFKTYIDTRYAEIVPRDHFQKMFQLFLNPVQIEQEAVHYKLPVIAINHTLANYHGAIRYFLASKNWRPVYADHFMVFFFHKNYRKDMPALNFEAFNAFLQKETNEWITSTSWIKQTGKMKKVYQTLVAATVFGHDQVVLALMQSIENKMDIKFKNLYCSILTYSARILPPENSNKRVLAAKAVSICEEVFYKVGDQSSAFNRATAAFTLGELTSAQEWVDRVLQLSSTTSSYYLLKAEILSAQGTTAHFKDIEESYQKALHLNPFQRPVWQELIRIQKLFRSAESAEKSRKEAQKFFPEI